MSLSLSEARRIWARNQGLGLDGSPSELPGGWTRTLGGADPYLALRARAPDLRVDAVARAIADDELWVCPGVRGCIWLMPRRDVSLALRVSHAADGRRFERDVTRAGSSLDELDQLGEQILAVLAAGPHTTDEVRRALPPESWRSLGDAGKKVGLSSTVPPALRRLEWAGRIRRKVVDHRLDHERYTWLLPKADPLALGVSPVEAEEQARELALRFFRWAGPATLDEFRSWSKLGKRISKQAAAALALREVEVDELGTCLAFPDGLEPARDERVYLLPGLDNLLSLRGSMGILADPARRAVELPGIGGRSKTLETVTWPQLRPIVHGGQWVGLWEWDPAAAEVVAVPFGAAVSGDDARPAPA